MDGRRAWVEGLGGDGALREAATAGSRGCRSACCAWDLLRPLQAHVAAALAACHPALALLPLPFTQARAAC